MTELICPACGPATYDMDHRCERCREIVLAREAWRDHRPWPAFKLVNGALTEEADTAPGGGDE